MLKKEKHRRKVLRNARNVYREKFGMQLVPLTPTERTELGIPKWDEYNIFCWIQPTPRLFGTISDAERCGPSSEAKAQTTNRQ